MNYEVKVFKNKQILAETTKIDLQNVEGESSSKRGFHMALAGGSTPRALYEQWATIKDESLWNMIHFFWGDERCVPPNHDDSNYKMAYDSFISKISVGEDKVHRIRGEDDPEIEVQRYADEIKEHLPKSNNNLPEFDWILLGVGTDGHTASLFADSAAAKEQQLICVIAEHPETAQRRISLSLPVINSAKKVTFLVTGKDKAQIVREIIKNKTLGYPAAQVKPRSGILQWYLDEAAARFLQS